MGASIFDLLLGCGRGGYCTPINGRCTKCGDASFPDDDEPASFPDDDEPAAPDEEQVGGVVRMWRAADDCEDPIAEGGRWWATLEEAQRAMDIDARAAGWALSDYVAADRIDP